MNFSLIMMMIIVLTINLMRMHVSPSKNMRIHGFLELVCLNKNMGKRKEMKTKGENKSKGEYKK